MTRILMRRESSWVPCSPRFLPRFFLPSFLSFFFWIFCKHVFLNTFSIFVAQILRKCNPIVMIEDLNRQVVLIYLFILNGFSNFVVDCESLLRWYKFNWNINCFRFLNSRCEFFYPFRILQPWILTLSLRPHFSDSTKSLYFAVS